MAISVTVVASAQAATISWSNFLAPDSAPADSVIDSGILTTTGTLVESENLGGPAATFDGISFAEGTTTLGNVFTGYYNGLAGNEIFNSGTWGGAGAQSFILDVVDGQEYVLELVFADARSAGKTVSVDGGAPAQYAYNSGAFPARIFRGTFTADAAIQAFSILTSDGNGEMQAYQLRNVTSVPEPSSVALLGLGGLALILRRRH